MVATSVLNLLQRQGVGIFVFIYFYFFYLYNKILKKENTKSKIGILKKNQYKFDQTYNKIKTLTSFQIYLDQNDTTATICV